MFGRLRRRRRGGRAENDWVGRTEARIDRTEAIFHKARWFDPPLSAFFFSRPLSPFYRNLIICARIHALFHEVRKTTMVALYLHDGISERACGTFSSGSYLGTDIGL